MLVTPIINGSGTITTLASFNGADGEWPYGSVIEDSSGNLFGTTLQGGAYSDGEVFEIVKGSGTITTLASFNGTNGAYPEAGLIEDSSGNLFGTTEEGSTSDEGTVFEIIKGSGTITTLASFNGTNGAYPEAGLIEDSSGSLFGTTVDGGASGFGYGTVFEIVRGSGTISDLATFNGTNGSGPVAGVIEDSSGNLFGTTVTSGASGHGYGTVFEISQGSSTITTLVSFNGTNGEHPQAGVIEDSSGDLFGTTYYGGACGCGEVFELVAAPATPTGLSATATGSTSISISWNSSSGATSYTLQRATSASGTYTQVYSGSATQYSDSGLSPNTTYYYEVAASNGSVSSSYSSPVSAATTTPWVCAGDGAFDGSGSTDMLWQNQTTGVVELALVNSSAISNWVVLGSAPPSTWKLAGIGKFTGNGSSDILWINTSNDEVGLWLVNNAALTGWATLAYVDLTTWNFKGVGDFNDDGTSDVLWENNSGVVGAWLIKNASVSAWAGMPYADPTQWEIVGVGDFTGSGTSDVLWQNTVNGTVGAWLISDGSVTAWRTLGNASASAWKVVAVGDFTNNGVDDLLWESLTTPGLYGEWLVQSSSVSWGSLPYADPTQWQLATVGNVVSDATDDIVWQNLSSESVGAWGIQNAVVAGWWTLGTV